MTIEITEFADVSIAVSPTGVSGGNFGILGFLTNEEGVVGAAERTRAYTSLSSVTDDWATSTEVYKAAAAFYGQTPTPKDFVALMCFETDQAATLTGGGHKAKEDLTLITAGNFNITVNGTAIAVDDLNLSGVPGTGQTYLDAVAQAVEDALTAANGATKICTVSHTGKQFQIVSDTTGIASTLVFAEGETGAGSQDAAEALGLTSSIARILAAGSLAETPVQALALNRDSSKFVGLVTHRKYRDVAGGADGTNTADIADWAEGAKAIFCNTTNNLATLDAGTTSDIASVMKNKSGVRFTLTTFSRSPKQYPSASVFGRAASVNFESTSSTITLNLKQMPTIDSEDLTPGEFKVLRSKNASAVVRIGSSVNAYTDSRMAGGSWLDTTHGLLWLENRAETDLFNLLYVNNTKIPFAQVGINTTVAVLERSLKAAVRNGLCAPGYLPDGTYLPEGFLVTAVPLADVPVGDKGSRIYKGLSFKMVGAGALHEVLVSGEFSE